MSLPERSPERDAAILALLPLVAEHGWSLATLRRALPEPGEAELLFPGGTRDLIETYVDLADRQMEEDAAADDMSELGLTKRVRRIIALRLARQREHREAIRRGLAILAGSPRLAATLTARTVDSIWHSAGDRSADISWYTKRAILASVYGSTLLYWLRDTSEDDQDTLAFLDRRLAAVGRIGKARAKLSGMLKAA